MDLASVQPVQKTNLSQHSNQQCIEMLRDIMYENVKPFIKNANKCQNVNVFKSHSNCYPFLIVLLHFEK